MKQFLLILVDEIKNKVIYFFLYKQPSGCFIKEKEFNFLREERIFFLFSLKIVENFANVV